MSTKVFILLFAAVLFASVIYSQVFEPRVHRAGPPHEEIENFYVELGHDEIRTITVLEPNQNFILTDVYCSVEDGLIRLLVYRNSSLQLNLQDFYNRTSNDGYLVNLTSGIPFNESDSLVVHHNEGYYPLAVTLSGYYFNN